MKEWIVKWEDFQKKFYQSLARFPALISAIGTGKTLFMLSKVYDFCEKYPDSLALIVRKEFTDLRDSTIKDFEKYFGVVVGTDKDFKFKNGSVIMFRHGKEIDVLKNINLSLFAIEQAEEFESEEQFTFLRDRLRRNNAPLRQGIVIGNVNGDNWIKRYWKDGLLQDAELIEATTFDNEGNLPKDFIDDLKRMETEAPAHYRQYVLNDWTVTPEQFILISPASLEALKDINIHNTLIKRLVSCDPATGGDECVIYMIESGKVRDYKFLHENDTMKIAGEIKVMGHKWNTNFYAIDSIGLGKGISDRMSEMGCEVTEINSAAEAGDKGRFYNKRAEMWWYMSKLVLDKRLPYPEDPELRRQLSNIKYKVVNSNGKLQLESKDDTRKRLGRSPDRADAFIYGVWQSQFVAPYKHLDAWAEDRDDYGGVKSKSRSAMAA